MDKKLQKGIIVILISNLINVFFSFATNFLLPKYLSIDSYAFIKTFQLYISYVGLLHFGYIDGMYLNYGGKNLKDEIDDKLLKNISTMRNFQLMIAMIFLIIAICIKDIIFLIFVLSIMPQNMINYFKFLYQATGEFKLYGKIMNITTISLFFINILLLFGLRSDNYLIYIVAYTIQYFVVWIFLEKSFKKKNNIKYCFAFDIKELIVNIKDGILLTIGNLASMLLTSMDRWFVKFTMTTLEFAYYSFAVSIESFLNIAITPVTTTLYNYFCREKDVVKNKEIFDYVLIFAVFLPIVAFPIKFVLEHFLVKYINSSSIIFVLFCAQMYYIVIKAVYVNLYKVQKKQSLYFKKLLFILIVGFVLNIIFYKIKQSMEAYAYGTLCAAVIWFLISINDFRDLKIEVKKYMFLCMASLLFLVIGNNFNSVIGFFIYFIITLFLTILFFNSAIKNISRGIKKFRSK